MALRRVLGLAAGLLLAVSAPVQLSQPFDAAEAAYILKPGTGTIEGDAFARKRNGRIVTAAGLDIYLLPDIPNTREMTAAIVAGRTLGDLPPELGNYMRVEKASAKSRFKFEQVSPGAYYVFTRIPWTERVSGETLTSSKRIVEHVKIGPGERKLVTVSGSILQ